MSWRNSRRELWRRVLLIVLEGERLGSLGSCQNKSRELSAACLEHQSQDPTHQDLALGDRTAHCTRHLENLPRSQGMGRLNSSPKSPA